MKDILFVDDERDLLESLRARLYKHRHDWNMTFLVSGEEAIATFERQHVDLIVSDVRMPGMNGLDLQRRVRLARPQLPIIFITAHHEDEVERTAFAEGAAFFIRKPFDAEELLRATRLALSKSSGGNRKTP